MQKNRNASVLIIDDNVDLCTMISRILISAEYTAYMAYNGTSGIEMYHSKLPDLVILDLNMPDISGMEVLKQIKRTHSEIPVIIISAQKEIRLAVDAIKSGAYDYVKKPFDNDEILLTVKRGLEEKAMRQEIFVLKTQLKQSLPLSEQMGYSKHIENLNTMVYRVAPTNFTVVVYGETGSGKELVSRCIHNHSKRNAKPFVVVDCGSIPETLVESELFGYAKGSFTGADQKKIGQFELASGGTLFLDEIGNLPLSTQSKLLRVLQERRIRPVGSSTEIDVDVRVIAAGNERLEFLVQSGRFRMDLYQRLNEFCIEIPPLRERKEDIEFLCKQFIDITNKELDKHVRGITKEALELLLAYDWPGNVRELKNVIRRAVLLADDVIEPGGLLITPRESKYKADHGEEKKEINHQIGKDPIPLNGNDKGFSLREMVSGHIERAEKEFIAEVLKQTGGNKTQAAKRLKINYKTLYYKVKKYGIKV